MRSTEIRTTLEEDVKGQSEREELFENNELEVSYKSAGTVIEKTLITFVAVWAALRPVMISRIAVKVTSRAQYNLC